MLCQDFPKALPICKCADDDAFLFIGEVTGTPTFALVTHLGGNRRTYIPVTADSGEWKCGFPELAPGQTYLLQVVNKYMTPIPFRPYQLSGTVMAPTATSYEGVYFEAIKCFEEDGSTYTGPDQWIQLP